MPLGPQFSNTYWEDPKSKKIMSSTERRSNEGELPTEYQRKPEIAEGFGTSANPQGMLFSPHSYTGLRDDPTVSTEQRMGAINKALNLGSYDEYKKDNDINIQKNKEREQFNSTLDPVVDRKRFKRPLSVYSDDHLKTVAEKSKAIGEAANNLDIPTRQYETGIDTRVAFTDWDKGWFDRLRGITVGVRGNAKTGYQANDRTLAHELGHTLERSGDEPQRDHTRNYQSNMRIQTDPVSEAHADALMDRAYHYSGQFEKHLTNPQLRAQDISTTGYSSKYHMWNAEERALYSAIRFHVASHPENQETMKNRKELGQSLYGHHHYNNDLEIPSTQLMLGHMYENMPHVRPLLHELGFGKTSKKAHETFMSRTETPASNRGIYKGKKREVTEQPRLPGFKN